MKISLRHALAISMLIACPSEGGWVYGATPSRGNAEQLFAEWARTHRTVLSTVKPGAPWDDLNQLGKMIGDATVVSLSEGVHCAAEPLEFRNRVLQYLVKEKGFTAIAIESGIVEGRIVHDYVRGGPGELATVVAQGIGWTMDRLPQNSAMVEWLRQYNADPKLARKVNFYGFDVPGSPANNQANRGHETAITEALGYLSRVDRAAGAAYHARLDALIRKLKFGLQRGLDEPGYESLGQIERDTLTAGISGLVSLLERKEAAYSAATTRADYEWAYRAAIGARQMDAWLRHMPIGWRPVANSESLTPEQHRIFTAAGNVRDRAQADNLDWVMQQEGSAGKILVFAHLGHLTMAPSYWPPDDPEYTHEVAGTYLHRRLGERLVTIGNLIGQGEAKCDDYHQKLAGAPRASLEGHAGRVGPPLYLLDIRAAPPAVRQWLGQEHAIAHGPPGFTFAVGKAVDILFYIDKVSPAY